MFGAWFGKTMAGRLARLIGDRSANVAIVFAFAAPVILMGSAATLSYVNTTRLKDRLTNAADAAVLSVVSQPGTQVGDYGQEDDDARNTRLKTYFQKNAAADFDHVTAATYQTNKSNGTTTANLTWKATASSIMPGFLSQAVMTIEGSSSSTSAEPLYVDFYVLIDASGSMGIGASAADQTKMQNGMGCTFACHITGGDTQAHNLGAKLRFDIVKDAVSSMVTTAKSKMLVPNEFRFAIYKFSNRLTQVRPLTPDNAAVTSALSSMVLDGNHIPQLDLEGSGTNFSKVLADMQNEVKTPGDGKTPGKPLVFFLIFTDGVGDDVLEKGNMYWVKDPLFSVYAPVVHDNGQYITGFDPSLCKPFKDKGVAVMTLDIGYVIPPGSGDERYVDIGNILKPKIMANMKACASRESYAFQAETPSEIQRAITKMFEAAFSKARLTN